MKFTPYNVKKNMIWHVPASIITLAFGIYLSLICLFPSFNTVHHEFVMNGKIFIIVPFAIFFLIGSPFFTLWYYTKLDVDQELSSQQVDACESD